MSVLGPKGISTVRAISKPERERSHALLEPRTTSSAAVALERTRAYDVAASYEFTTADEHAGPCELTTPHEHAASYEFTTADEHAGPCELTTPHEHAGPCGLTTPRELTTADKIARLPSLPSS